MIVYDGPYTIYEVQCVCVMLLWMCICVLFTLLTCVSVLCVGNELCCACCGTSKHGDVHVVHCAFDADLMRICM